FQLKAFSNKSGVDFSAAILGKSGVFFEDLLNKKEYLRMDADTAAKPWMSEAAKFAPIESIVLFPLRVDKSVAGIIAVGNFIPAYELPKELIGVIRAFEKELVLAYQSARLFLRMNSFDIVDSLTGLYSRVYIEERLKDELNRAIFYQRPCSLILLSIDEFKKYSAKYGQPKAERLLKKVAEVIGGIMSPVGKGARFNNEEFAVLLPEKNKRETLESAEDIRKNIENMEISGDPYERVTVSIGIGENPIDGSTAAEIMSKAGENLRRAREEGGNRVMGE
ncbi:MAG: diguanylate cyclase, partial [Candidatus Omnitrophota bacterium]